MPEGTAFSTVLFKYDVIDSPTSFFYREKRSALFWCRGRIEIKYLFSWLLQNNLFGVENVVWNTKASANASAILFQAIFLDLGGYSATNTITRALFLKFKWQISCKSYYYVSYCDIRYACIDISIVIYIQPP